MARSILPKRFKLWLLIVVGLSCLMIAIAVFASHLVEKYYQHSINLITNQEYERAIDQLDNIRNYKDSSYYINQVKLYYEALNMYTEGKYLEASEHFNSLDSQLFPNYLELSENALLQYANQLFANHKYIEVISLISEYNLENNTEANTLLINSKRIYSNQLFDDGKYEEAYALFSELGDEENALKASLAILDSARAELYSKAEQYFEDGYYNEALEIYNSLDDYRDSRTQADLCRRLLSATTISAGVQYSVAVTTENKVVTTSNDAWQKKLSEWEDIVSVSGMDVAVIGLHSDGTVELCTSSSEIQLNDEWKDLIAVSAGELYVVGLRNDGRVIANGHEAGDEQTLVSEWENITAIATGWRHTVGLRNDGTILITGFNAKSQKNSIDAQLLNKPPASRQITAIAAGGGHSSDSVYPGEGHTVCLCADGTVIAGGDNTYGQCNTTGEEWTDIVAVAAGDWFTIGLRSDGSVVSTTPIIPEDLHISTSACNVSDWKDIVAISACCGMSLGLTQDGRVLFSGYPSSSIKTWTNIRAWGPQIILDMLS